MICDFYLGFLSGEKNIRKNCQKEVRQKNTLDSYIRFLAGAAFGLNLTQSLVWAELDDEEIKDEPRFNTIAERIHEKLETDVAC